MIQDPYYQRESAIYIKPVASRELLLQIISERKRPVSVEQLLTKLKITDPESIEGLNRRLRAMIRDGQIVLNKQKKFQSIVRANLKQGRIQGTKDAVGYCIFSDGSEPLLIREQQMRQVFDGDVVLVNERAPIDNQSDGIIVEVTERNTKHIVGNICHTSKNPHVISLNRRNQHISINITGDTGYIEEGALVKVRIDKQPGITTKAQGYVVSILDIKNSGQEIDIALLNHRLRNEWSKDALKETVEMSEDISPADIQQRFDMRDMAFVTIDGDDSRDFDDSVYCKKEKLGFRLWVAIADVSHYVRAESSLDKEARLRGNSVYFPREVIHMLPERLSNGICSLNPRQDRLVLVCEMHISPQGMVSEYCFFEAVLQSHARLTYDELASILANEHKQQYSQKVIENLLSLKQVYQALMHRRNTRGALSIELPELRFIFDGHTIKKLTHVHRNIAHKIIEESMIAANVCAAELLTEHSMPALYRIHNEPEPERIDELRRYIKPYGLNLGGGRKPKPTDILRLIEQMSDVPHADILYMQLLRTMSKAEYTPEQKQHFGLACQRYCHFTSPIRRYPDLLVHRAIRSLIHSSSKLTGLKRVKGADLWQHDLCYPYNIKQLKAMGLHCTDTELRADNASRDVQQYLRCVYLQQFIGHVFAGLVKTVTHFGLFVEMEDTCSEGLLHVSQLRGDYYIFDSSDMIMRGERTGTVYKSGSKMHVRLVRVDLERGLIDLEPVSSSKNKKKKKPKRTSQSLSKTHTIS